MRYTVVIVDNLQGIQNSMSMGPWQIVIIAFLFVALFSAGRINRFFKELGKGVKSFKDEMDDANPPKRKTAKVVSLDSARKKAAAKKTTAKKAPAKRAAAKKTVAKKSAAKKAAPKKTVAKKPAAKKAAPKKKTAPR